MSLELMILLAERLRRLSSTEFAALKLLVQSGIEDDRHLSEVSDALLDCIGISDEYGQPKMRIA